MKMTAYWAWIGGRGAARSGRRARRIVTAGAVVRSRSHVCAETGKRGSGHIGVVQRRLLRGGLRRRPDRYCRGQRSRRSATARARTASSTAEGGVRSISRPALGSQPGVVAGGGVNRKAHGPVPPCLHDPLDLDVDGFRRYGRTLTSSSSMGTKDCSSRTTWSTARRLRPGHLLFLASVKKRTPSGCSQIVWSP